MDAKGKIPGLSGHSRYGKWNPLLYECAQVVRAIHERWSVDPTIRLHTLSKFLYALCGTGTFFAYLFLILGLEFSESFSRHLRIPKSPTASVASETFTEPYSELLEPWMFRLVALVLFSLFFAILLATVKKQRGRIMLYLEGVALPAATTALIRLSALGSGATGA